MPVVVPNIRSINNADGAVILDIPRDQIITLNPTGAYIWDGLRHNKTVDTIIHDLATETDTDPTIVAQDVHSFVDQLISDNLLKS